MCLSMSRSLDSHEGHSSSAVYMYIHAGAHGVPAVSEEILPSVKAAFVPRVIPWAKASSCARAACMYVIFSVHCRCRCA